MAIPANSAQAQTASPVADHALFEMDIPNSGDVDVSQLHKLMDDFAKTVTVTTNTTENKAAKFRDKPIFRWENPERKSVAGNLFLWTVNGRPQASMGIWCARGLGSKFEMQSFSESNFNVKFSNETWTPTEPGLKFAELNGAEAPGKSHARRLFQMRKIMAKHFRAELFKFNSSRPERLRMLPTPIYKYDELPKGVLSGAMYSFAMGTDPEVLVLLEARQSDSSQPAKWYFAFVPSTGVEVKGYLNNNLVFHRSSGLHDHGSFLKQY